MRMPPRDSPSRPVTSAVICTSFAKDGPQDLERIHQRAAENQQNDQRRDRQLPIDVKQNADRDRRGDDAAEDLAEARADEISDSLGVVHDPRDQLPALCRVEIRDRQPFDVRCCTRLSHIGDRPLRGDAEDLRKRKTRNALDQRRNADGERDPFDQRVIVLS